MRSATRWLVLTAGALIIGLLAGAWVALRWSGSDGPLAAPIDGPVKLPPVPSVADKFTAADRAACVDLLVAETDRARRQFERRWGFRPVSPAEVSRDTPGAAAGPESPPDSGSSSAAPGDVALPGPPGRYLLGSGVIPPSCWGGEAVCSADPETGAVRIDYRPGKRPWMAWGGPWWTEAEAGYGSGGVQVAAAAGKQLGRLGPVRAHLLARVTAVSAPDRLLGVASLGDVPGAVDDVAWFVGLRLTWMSGPGR